MKISGAVNKKGISHLVSTVLFVMIIVLAVGIIAIAVIPMIRDNLSNSIECQFNDVHFETSKGYTCYDSVHDLVAIQIAKGIENVNVSGLKFLISSSGSSFSYNIKFNFENDYTPIFYLNTSILASVDKLAFAPILTEGKSLKECSKIELTKVPVCVFSDEEISNIVEKKNILLLGA